MLFEQGKKMLEDRGLFNDRIAFAYSWKKARSHNFRYETIEHFISKAFLVYLINKKSVSGNKMGALSEYQFPNGRVLDVLQLIWKDKEMTGYEIETTKDNHKKSPDNFPVITIDLRKAPQKVHESFKILEEFFKDFVV